MELNIMEEHAMTQPTWRTLDPQEAASAPIHDLGGKAHGLACLERIHAQVPAWRVVPADFFAAYLRQPALEGVVCRGLMELGELLEGVEVPSRAQVARAGEICRQMQEAMSVVPLPRAMASAILEAVRELGSHHPLAVRSSMVGEDSEAHSFAGQLESYLYRRSAAEVLEAVHSCWMSALAPRVLLYRHRAGLGLLRPRLGVVIQCMIEGVSSGVAFGADPQTGRRDRVLLAAAWGCGEGVVNGLCNSDEWLYDDSGRLVRETLADKDVALEPVAGQAGLVEVELDELKRRAPCLGEEVRLKLAAEVRRICERRQRPQDIEWTWDGRRLWILQSRPISALPNPSHDEGPVVVFDNSNIQESYCGVTTPLTFSFASSAYASVYTQTLRVLGLPEETIRQHKPLLDNLLGLVHGRVYYNLNNWYRGLQILPSFGRNKADMEAMMGVEEPVDFVEDEILSLRQKARRAPRLLATALRLQWQFARLDREVPAFMRRFEAVYRSVDRSSLGDISFSALMRHLEVLRRDMLGRWTTPILNDFRVMMAMGKLRRLVERSGVGEPNALLNDLLAGEEGMASTEPTYALMRMARMAAGDPVMAAALREQGAEEAWTTMRAHSRGMTQAMDEYVARYGDRTMGELKLETRSLREDPSFIVRVMRAYLDRPDLDPRVLQGRERMRRRRAEETLRAGLGWPDRARMSKVLGEARAAVKDREEMRLARTRMFGLFRDLYQVLGERLEEAGRLHEARDVFYLTVEEIDAYHQGRAVSADLANIAQVRKAEFARHQASELPHRFETRGPVYHGNSYACGQSADVDPDAVVLRGLGCYAGVVEAPLKVVMSPEDELSMDGAILTTLRTDPGWAPLFPTAGGILVERGSTLSHSAVVARELGIPAVVGVPGLLSIVRSGERVRLDGGAGTVTRLEVAT